MSDECQKGQIPASPPPDYDPRPPAYPPYPGPQGPPGPMGPPGAVPVVSQPPPVIFVQQQVMVAGPIPVELNCPMCQWRIMTEVHTKSDNSMQLILAAVLCFVGCWPCCLIPLCMDGEQTFTHRCPNCKAVLAQSK